MLSLCRLPFMAAPSNDLLEYSTPMPLYNATVPQLSKMLGNLSRWLDEAIAYAESREFDPESLLQARLYPDQFALVRQVQAACDSAKFIGARLSDTEAPSHPDTETTLPELKARIESTIGFIQGLDEAAFEGAGERRLFLPFLHGAWVSGDDYLNEFGLPNFYFHVTTAYAILRHNGVKLGKRTFIGNMNANAPE